MGMVLMSKEVSSAEAASLTLKGVYSSPFMKWIKGIQFVVVKMDGCEVYTPCSHIKPDMQLIFRDKLQQIYEISKNKS